MKNLTIILLLVLSIGCNNKEQSEEKTEPDIKTDENIVQLTDAQAEYAGIRTGKLEQRNLSSIIKTSGTIEVSPQNTVTISVPLGGYLKSSKLLPGMYVTKGSTIAIMEDHQYIQLQEDYLTTKAKLVFAEHEYLRQRDLNESKASSDKVFQQSVAEYTSLKVQLKSLSEKLKLIGLYAEHLNHDNISKNIRIASPISGYVSKVNVNTGKYVNPSDVLFEILNVNNSRLLLNVFEKDIDNIFIGQKLFAYSNNFPDKRYQCEVVLIGKDFSEKRSIDVYCSFENYDKSLVPGMFMNAEIEVQNKNTYVLPTEAVVNFENKQYAFIQKNNKEYKMIEIKTGIAQSEFVEIIGDESKDIYAETFVTKGAYTLLMKMKNTADE